MFKGVGCTVYLKAWDNDNLTWKTAYQASITARGCGDGTEFTPAGSVSQVDATNFPGLYKVTLTDAENNYDVNAIGGNAADSTITIHGMEWINLPLDFSSTQKTSLNAATPASVTTVTGNVNGSVASVTNAVTITSNADITSILADTNELQGLITSSKLPAQVKGMDADVITTSALKTDAVTEIVTAIGNMIIDGVITLKKQAQLRLAKDIGNVVVDGNTIKYYDQSGALLLTDPITLSGSTRVVV